MTSSQYYRVTARVGVPHRNSVEVTIPLVGPAGAQGPSGASDYTELTNVPESFTPSAHAASHLPESADELFDQSLNTTDNVTFSDGNFQSFTTLELSVTGEAGISFPDEDGRINTRDNLGLGPAALEDFAAPPAIGNTTPAAGNFTTFTLKDSTGGEVATFDAQAKLTANRTYDLPDASGTLALLSDLILSKLNGTVVLAPTSDVSTTSTSPASVAGMSFTAQADTNYLVIASLQLDVAASGGGCVLDASTPNITGGATSNGIQCLAASTTINALTMPSSTSIRVFRATAAQSSSGILGAAFSISTVRFTASGTVDFNWALVGASANTSTIKSESRVVFIPLT
jgi:hypothetical protein